MLSVSILEEFFRLLPHTVFGEKREGRGIVDVWVGAELRPRRVPRQGPQGWETLWGELSMEGTVWCQQEEQESKRGGQASGWAANPGVSGDPRPRPGPSPGAPWPLSFLSASHSCRRRGCQRPLHREQNMLLSCSKSISGCSLSSGCSAWDLQVERQPSCGRFYRVGGT